MENDFIGRFIHLQNDVLLYGQILCNVGQNLATKMNNLSELICEKSVVAALTGMTESEIDGYSSIYQYVLHDSDVQTTNIVENIRSKYDLPSMSDYSDFNIWFLIKRFNREHKSATKHINEIKNEIRYYFEEIKTLEKEINPYQSHTNEVTELLDEIYKTKKHIHNLLQAKFYIYPDFLPVISVAFVQNGFITKNQLLSIITVSKKKRLWDGSKDTTYQEIMTNVPEQIDLETFEKLIFLQKIEDEDDCFIADQYYRQFMKAIENPEIKEKMHEALNEVFDFDKVPKYRVETDEFGDVTHIESI